ASLFCHQFGLFAGLGTGLQAPVKGALFPYIYVANDQCRDKNHDLDKCNGPENGGPGSDQAFECHGERYDKKDFYIEEKEYYSDGVKLDREALPGRPDRVLTALVRH